MTVTIYGVAASRARCTVRSYIKWLLRRRSRDRLKAAGLLVYYRSQVSRELAELQA